VTGAAATSPASRAVAAMVAVGLSIFIMPLAEPGMVAGGGHARPFARSIDRFQGNGYR
jgi:hypothetical protein